MSKRRGKQYRGMKSEGGGGCTDVEDGCVKGFSKGRASLCMARGRRVL